MIILKRPIAVLITLSTLLTDSIEPPIARPIKNKSLKDDSATQNIATNTFKKYLESL